MLEELRVECLCQRARLDGKLVFQHGDTFMVDMQRRGAIAAGGVDLHQQTVS